MVHLLSLPVVMVSFSDIRAALPELTKDEQRQLYSLLSLLVGKEAGGLRDIVVPRELEMALATLNKLEDIGCRVEQLALVSKGRDKLKRIIKDFESNDYLQEDIIELILRSAVKRRRDMGHPVTAYFILEVLGDYSSYLNHFYPSYWASRRLKG